MNNPPHILSDRLRLRKSHRRRRQNRRGTAMIIAVVCLTLLAALTVSLVRLALAAQQQVVREQWRLQSVWLAESALNRAAVQLDEGGEVATDDWTPTDIGPSALSGRVTIAVEADPNDETRLTLTATADFPDHPIDRVRTTRVRTLTRTTDDTASAEETE